LRLSFGACFPTRAYRFPNASRLNPTLSAR
jgi:hypothetical protein